MNIEQLKKQAVDIIDGDGVIATAHRSGLSVATVYTVKNGGKVKIETLLKIMEAAV